jgi:predicted  nucleic acid-binding Zn-ribbon protein
MDTRLIIMLLLSIVATNAQTCAVNMDASIVGSFTCTGDITSAFCNVTMCTLKTSVNGLITDASALESRVTTAEDYIQTLLDTVAPEQSDIAALQAQMTTVQTNITTLKGQINVAQTNLTQIEAEIVALSDVSQMQTDISNIQADVTAAQDAITQTNLDVDALDTRLTSDEGDISTLQGQMTAAQNAIIQTNSDVDALDTRLTTDEGDISTLQGQMTTAQNSITQTNSDVDALDTRLTTDEGDISTLQGQMTTAQNSITQTNSDVDALDTRLTTDEGNIGTLQSDLSTAQSAITALQNPTAFSATTLTATATTNQLILGAVRTLTLSAPTPATASRVYTIPDVSTNSQFVMTNGGQTVDGIKRFLQKASINNVNLDAVTVDLQLSDVFGSRKICMRSMASNIYQFYGSSLPFFLLCISLLTRLFFVVTGLGVNSGEFRFQVSSGTDKWRFAAGSSSSTEQVSADLSAAGLLTLSAGLVLPTAGGTATSLTYFEEYKNTGFNFFGPIGIVPITVRVTRTGKTIVVTVASLQAPGNTTPSVILSDALPARFWPATTIRIPLIVTDNSVVKMGSVKIDATNGQFYAWAGMTDADEFLDATGTYGWPDAFSMSYSIN